MSARRHDTSMRAFPAQIRRLIDLLGPTRSAARLTMVALAFNSITSFAAGSMMVGFSHTWEVLPPALMLVPAAIGLRGNVFSSMGNRLSTAIHTGTFRLSASPDSVLGQNLIASFSLTATLSVALAAAIKVLAVAIGVRHAIPVWDLITISLLGGFLGSVVVAAATVLLTRGAVRYEWDLDNLVAPTVSTLGDVVTIPALWLAAQLVLHASPVARGFGIVALPSMFALSVWAWRSPRQMLRQIYRESLPVLGTALILSALAGVVLDRQQRLLMALPAIFVLQPAFVSSAGALGGILCGRVATSLHLGAVEPSLTPGAEVGRDARLIGALAVPLVALNGIGAWLFTRFTTSGPYLSVWWVLLVCAIASAVTVTFVAALAYYSTIGAWRANVDPDSYGTPIVTSAVDFVGTMTLVFTVVSLGLR
jgi:mgtE-like transporter